MSHVGNERRFVTLVHGPTGRPFFAAAIDAAPCGVCSARSTFLFNDRTDVRLCNTCCGALKGLAVMAARHGYGAFAIARNNGPFPEPHIDPPVPPPAPLGALVFRRGDVVCEMGGTLVAATDLDAVYGELGTPYASGGPSPSAALDSTLVRNAAAYINAGDAGEAPNVRIVASDDGCAVVATDDIRHGEELLLDYGADFPWDVACLVTEHAVAPFTTVVTRDRVRGTRAVLAVD
jgi:hypothetical protein